MAPGLQRPLSPARKKLRRVEQLQCPAYEPSDIAYDPVTQSALIGGVYSRSDFDYPRSLISTTSTSAEQRAWSPEGWCAVPKVDLYVSTVRLLTVQVLTGPLVQTFDFVLSQDGSAIPEDPHPTAKKLAQVPDGFILQDVEGIRTRVVSRMDGKGYDITKCKSPRSAHVGTDTDVYTVGPFSVKTGQLVYVNDTHLLLAPASQQVPMDGSSPRRRIPEFDMRVFLDSFDPLAGVHRGMHDQVTEALIRGFTSMFAGDPVGDPNKPPLKFGHGDGDGVRLVRDFTNPYGCDPYTQDLEGDTVVLLRGECTFLEKLMNVAAVGGSGAIAISDEEYGVNPSADKEELDYIGGSLDHVAIVVVDQHDGAVLTSMLDAADTHDLGQVMMSIARTAAAPESRDSGLPPEESLSKAREGNRVLYLNGHPLLNTRLMV